MLICNCTLPYTNPEACKNCNNMKYGEWQTTNDLWIGTSGFWESYKLNTYNPETHELVEKKEAKIKRLDEELEKNKLHIEAYKEYLKIISKAIGDLEIKNGEILEELKQLK